MPSRPRNITANRERLIGFVKRSQQEVNHWFSTYNLSFRDPTRFATVLVDKYLEIHELEQAGLPTADLIKKSGYNVIYEILQEIRDLRSHRHRVDAANILEEVNRRVQGDAPRQLISRPMNAPPPVRSQAEMDEDDLSREPFDDIDDYIMSKMPPVGENDGLPTPWIRVSEGQYGKPFTTNMKNLQVAYELATKFSQSIAVRCSIFDILAAGTNHRGLDPPIFLDNPAEVVLEMPENLRFIDDPIGEIDATLLDQTQWPKLDIFDLRRGPVSKYGQLEDVDYIYQLISLARQTLCQPEIARKYAIVFRAYPSRYQDNTPEEFVDEEAPTVEEG